MVRKTRDQIKNRRRFRRTEAEQGSCGYVAPRRVAEPHRRRSAQWNDKKSDEEIFRRIDGRNDRRSDQEPEKISENGSRTRQWWLRRPAAGRRTTPPTLGSIIRPSHRQAGNQVSHPRPKGHHPDDDPLWPAGRSNPGKRSQTGLNFWGRRSESQQEVGHVRRARSRSTKEVIQTAAGQPRRWTKSD